MTNFFLDQEVCYPGHPITGKVECFFNAPTKVNAIYVKLKGKSETYWTEGEDSCWENEEYFNTRHNLSADNHITLPPGTHIFTFSVPLPWNAPSSIKRKAGKIKYSITAVVDLPGKINWEDKKEFVVGCYLDLNDFEVVKNPISKTEVKRLMFFNDESIEISVGLPVSGAVPSQTVYFNTTVKNMAGFTLEGIRFKIVQVFEFYATRRKHTEELKLGDTFIVTDGEVKSGCTKSWNLGLVIPTDTFVPNLTGCSIIKMFCELRGTVVFPFPYRNLKIKVPFTLGTVPIKNSASSPSKLHLDKILDMSM